MRMTHVVDFDNFVNILTWLAGAVLGLKDDTLSARRPQSTTSAGAQRNEGVNETKKCKAEQLLILTSAGSCRASTWRRTRWPCLSDLGVGLHGAHQAGQEVHGDGRRRRSAQAPPPPPATRAGVGGAARHRAGDHRWHPEEDASGGGGEGAG